MKKRTVVLSLIGTLSMVAVISAVPASQLVNAKTAASTTTEETSEENDDDATLANVTVALTEDQAKTIALDSIQDGSFVSIELEDEDGVIVYGVEILSGNTENDVKVDANTGEILKTETGDDSEEIESEDNDSEDIESDDNDSEENESEDQDSNSNEDDDSSENSTEINE